MISLIYGSLKKGTCELIYKTSRVMDVENKFMVIGGNGRRDKLGDWDCHIHTTVNKIGN